MIRKIVSLTLAWMFLISSISGVMLFISPPGRVAYWTDWSFLGFTKTQWDHLHTVTTLLMIIAVILHLYYNWKPFTSYMKNSITKAFSATKELILSIVFTTVIALGAIFELVPFNFIINTGDYISEDWEVTYGSPPYNHAELDTLKTFCKKLNINYEVAKSTLEKSNLTLKESHSLLRIATDNKISPQKIFEIITFKTSKQSLMPREGSGMGKKTLSQVCEIRGLNLKKVLIKLRKNGIEANGTDKFKIIAQKYKITPMKLLEIIEER